jgi:hypothetical protein
MKILIDNSLPWDLAIGFRQKPALLPGDLKVKLPGVWWNVYEK